MAQVSVNINNRSYSMECDDGQQHRVAELSKYVDAKVRQMAGAGAAYNESHLLVLSSILLADEIFELRESLTALGDHVESKAASDQHEQAISEAIDTLASRIDTISERIKAA